MRVTLKPVKWMHLEIGQHYTNTITGNGTLFQKVSQWRFSWYDGIQWQKTVKINRDILVYPIAYPIWG